MDPRRGVVTVRGGEARCFLKITGYSAHLRSQEDTRAWLQGYARVLNTLPGNAVLIVRSRPGGLQGHVERQRAQTAALAEREPGSALARLAADQLAHARTLQETGQVRQTDQYVALRSPSGNAGRLLAAAEACRRHLQTVDVYPQLVTDEALLNALAVSWRPEEELLGRWPETWTQDWPDPRSGAVAAVLNYAPKNARVTAPKYADGAPTAGPTATVRRVDDRVDDGHGAPLPRHDGDGKALPR